MVRRGGTEAMRRVWIGAYFATWCALNMMFKMYNKKVLNVNSYPVITCLFSLPVGLLMILISWATRIAETPKTDLKSWKTLFWVGVAYTIGHVIATMSITETYVGFTHITKSSQPLFNVWVSRFLLGDLFLAPLYLPIIGGCGLASLNFNMIGFVGAMISNLALVFWNIFSTRDRRSL